MTTLQNKIEEAKKRFDEKFNDIAYTKSTIDYNGWIPYPEAKEELSLFISQELTSIAALAQEEARKEAVEQVMEIEKTAFKVSSGRHCILNEETIDALERGERRAVPIRSLDFPTFRTEPPTMDEFNKNTIILKKD